MSFETVHLPLGARAYDIHIGERLIDEAGALMSPLLPRPRTVVVTDKHVAAAQGERLKNSLYRFKTG